jgi:hypothetical protein
MTNYDKMALNNDQITQLSAILTTKYNAKSLNSEQTKALVTLLSGFAKHSHEKKMKSVRNKRYYQRHSDKIKQKRQNYYSKTGK